MIKYLKKIFVIFITLHISKPILATYTESAELKQGPCEDFYKYACRNYSYANNALYSEITQHLAYNISYKVLKHFEYLPRPNTRDQNYKDKMLIYYKSCRWETRRNIIKYLGEVKPAINLNWPLLQRPNQIWLGRTENFDLWSLVGELQSYGLNNVIINHEIFRNEDNTLAIWLTPQLIPEQGSFQDTTAIEVLLKTLGLTDEQTIIQELMATDTMWQNYQQQYDDYFGQEEIFTYGNLSQIYQPLKLYLTALVGTKELSNIAFVSLENPKYFKFIMENRWSNKNFKQITNYLMIKLIYFLAVDSTAEYTALECIKDVRNKFDLAVNYLSYHHLYRYDNTIFQTNYTLIENLKNTMIKYIKENHLNLSQHQLKYLENKLQNIKINIGNLPSNANYSTINNFYLDVYNLDPENYYKNHLLLLKHLFRKSLLNQQNQSYYMVTNKNMAGLSSPFYIPQLNMIIIPIGSFQQPLFHYKIAMQLQQIALFGFVLAHEMGHAFDTTGLKYDRQGYPLTETLHIESQDNFIKALECMQKQQPTEEIDERIADFVGVRVAYQTFADYYANNNGRNWQTEFFLHMAEFFCGAEGLEFIDHDADSIRLNEIVKNLPEFAKTFMCPLDSPMNPRSKCRLY